MNKCYLVFVFVFVFVSLWSISGALKCLFLTVLSSFTLLVGGSITDFLYIILEMNLPLDHSFKMWNSGWYEHKLKLKARNKKTRDNLIAYSSITDFPRFDRPDKTEAYWKNLLFALAKLWIEGLCLPAPKIR